MNRPDPSILWLALRTSRPRNGAGVRILRDAIAALAPAGSARVDSQGALWVDLRRDSADRTLFAAHLDTVARREGAQGISWIGPGLIGLDPGAGECLGADDGAGAAALAVLIQAQVPALYYMSPDEESGSAAAKHAAIADATLLSNFDRCIALDRRGTTDICDSQFIGTIASPEFTKALSAGLSLGHASAQGSFTDSSEFHELIPEIVNVSIGYDKNHGPNETLNFIYWKKLVRALMALDLRALPTVRAAGPPEDSWGAYWAGGRTSGWGHTSGWEGLDLDPVPARGWALDPVREALDLDPDEADLLALDRGAARRAGSSLWALARDLADDLGIPVGGSAFRRIVRTLQDARDL